MAFLMQLKMLLWKNFILRKRQPFRVVVELVWPLCLFLILLAVRFRPDIREDKPECHYNPRAMPSAGTLAFLQSYVCTFDNKCNPNISSTDIQGNISLFNSSLLDLAVSDLETLLLTTDIDQLVEELDTFVTFVERIVNDTSQLESIGLRLQDVVINRQDLLDIVANQSIALSPEAIDTLLNASLDFQQVVEDLNTSSVQNLLSLAFEIYEAQIAQVPSNVTVESIRENVCDNELLLRYFDFGSQAQAVSLQNQLCNLTAQELTTFALDVYNDINITLVSEEVSAIITDVTSLTFDIQQSQILQIFNNNASDLSSLGAVLQDFASALPQLSGGGTSGVSTLSSLICGGNGEVF